MTAAKVSVDVKSLSIQRVKRMQLSGGELMNNQQTAKGCDVSKA
jgi:hypothetical protein